ncbi:MAG: capsid protein [Circular genetic element sp.]|nr:MAG: capsid protein [Circular genetic element sp.]
MAGIKRKYNGKAKPSPYSKKRRMSTFRRSLYSARRMPVFKRSFVLPNNIIPGAASSAKEGLLGASFATLKMCPEATKYIQLFDQYRITHVKWTFTNLSSPSNTLTPHMPVMYWTPDFDDATQPTTKRQIVDSAMCKRVVMPPGKNVYMNVKPLFTNTVYENPPQTGFGIGDRKQWLNTSTDTVRYYGVKYCIANCITDDYQIGKEQTIWVEFRGAGQL